MTDEMLGPDAWTAAFLCFESVSLTVGCLCSFGLLSEWHNEGSLKWSMIRTLSEGIRGRLISSSVTLGYSFSSLSTIISFTLHFLHQYQTAIGFLVASALLRHSSMALTLGLMVLRLSVFEGTTFAIPSNQRRIYLAIFLVFLGFFTIWHIFYVWAIQIQYKYGANHPRAKRYRSRLWAMTGTIVGLYILTVLSISWSFARRLIEMVSQQNSWRRTIAFPHPPSSSPDSTSSPRTMIEDTRVFDAGQQRLIKLATKHVTLALTKSTALLLSGVILMIFRTYKGKDNLAYLVPSLGLSNVLSITLNLCVYMGFPSAQWLYLRMCAVCDRSIADRVGQLSLNQESQLRKQRKERDTADDE